MPIALNINTTKRFVLKCDRRLPEEQQTIFVIGTLDVRERIKIEDEQAEYGFSASRNADDKADMKVKRHKRNYEIVRLGVKDWENFKDAEGKEIIFDTVAQPGVKNGSKNIVSEQCMSRLALEWIDELAEAIIGENSITEEETKNS